MERCSAKNFPYSTEHSKHAQPGHQWQQGILSLDHLKKIIDPCYFEKNPYTGISTDDHRDRQTRVRTSSLPTPEVQKRLSHRPCELFLPSHLHLPLYGHLY